MSAKLLRKKETWLDLLRCLSSQPQAAAQATAVSLGAYHTAALLTHSRADPAALKLYAFGRGVPTRNQQPQTKHRHAQDSAICVSSLYVSS